MKLGHRVQSDPHSLIQSSTQHGMTRLRNMKSLDGQVTGYLGRGLGGGERSEQRPRHRLGFQLMDVLAVGTVQARDELFS